MVEPQRGVLLEHPRARFERRPRHGHAGAADLAPEQQAHAHVVAAGEADAAQRQPESRRRSRCRSAGRRSPRPSPPRNPRCRPRCSTGRAGHARIHHHVVRHLAGAGSSRSETHPVVGAEVVAFATDVLMRCGSGSSHWKAIVERVAVVGDPHTRCSPQVDRLALDGARRRSRSSSPERSAGGTSARSTPRALPATCRVSR